MKLTQILLVCSLLLSSVMMGMTINESELIKEEIDLKQESTPNQITPSHIELWSSSSSLNPQIPF